MKSKATSAMPLTIFGMIYQQGISFVSGVIIARVIGASEYGVFSLARNIQQLVGLFCRLGFEVSLQRFMGEVGKNPELQSIRLGMIGHFRLVALGLSLIPIAILALGFGGQIEEHIYRYDHFAAVLLVTFIAVPFLSDIAVLGGVYRGTLNPTPSVIAEYILQPSIRLLTILILFALGFRLWGVVVGSAFASIVASLFLTLKFRRYQKSFFEAKKRVNDTRLFGATIRYSAVIVCAMGVTTLTRSVDSFYLGYYTTAADVGQYALVQMMLILVGLFGTALGQTLGAQIAERFSAGDNAGVEELLERNVRLSALVSCPIFAVFFFWGADLMLVFGSSYQFSVNVIRWLSGGALLITLTASAGFALSMSGRHTLELKILILGLVVSALLGALFVPKWGQLGAAVAVFVSLAIVNMARLYVVWRNLNVFHLRWGHIRILIIAMALSFPLSFTAGGESYERILRAGSGALAYLLIYVASSWLLMSVDERNSIKRIVLKLLDKA